MFQVSNETVGKDRDKYSWLLCMRGKDVEQVEHDPENLMLTQVIAGDALNELGRQLHFVREKYGIPQLCGCVDVNKLVIPDQQKPVGGTCKVTKEVMQARKFKFKHFRYPVEVNIFMLK